MTGEAGWIRARNPLLTRQGGAKISYDNSMHDLLEHSNKSTKVTNILNNRKSTMGGDCSGTCLMNTAPPTLMSVASSDSSSRAKYLYNPQGPHERTMVYGKILEDAACRPREYSVWCDQCLAHQPVHTQEPCLILFVTGDQELSHGFKSHMGGLRDSSFQDR